MVACMPSIIAHMFNWKLDLFWCVLVDGLVFFFSENGPIWTISCLQFQIYSPLILSYGKYDKEKHHTIKIACQQYLFTDYNPMVLWKMFENLPAPGNYKLDLPWDAIYCMEEIHFIYKKRTRKGDILHKQIISSG